MRYCWKGPYSSVKRLGRLSGRAIDASCSRYCSTAQTFNKVGLGHRFDLVVLTNTRLGPVFFCILEVRTRETAAAWAEFAARSSLRGHVMCVRRLCGARCPSSRSQEARRKRGYAFVTPRRALTKRRRAVQPQLPTEHFLCEGPPDCEPALRPERLKTARETP